MSAEYFFLALLITSHSEPQLGGFPYAALQEAGNKLVVDWDIAEGNFFQNEWQFIDDINMLRTRIYELDGMPHSSLVYKLPSIKHLEEGIEANEKYQKELKTRMIIEKDREELLWTAYLEAQELHTLWDHALAARRAYTLICTRSALKELGVDNPEFTMPPCLPYWRLP